MWYNIDFNIWAVNLLPTRLRKVKMIAFVKTMIASVVNLHYEFRQRQEDDAFLLDHNGQVCYLTKALNDKFDSFLRRIYIGDKIVKYTPNYIFTSTERTPLFLDEKVYVRERTEYAYSGVDFIVYAPSEVLQAYKLEIEALVNYFKKGTKKYKLIAV